MPDALDSALSIRAALNRKALADARHRAALARRLGLTAAAVLAVQHLARAGELTTSQLATQLQLSSGGTTALSTVSSEQAKSPAAPIHSTAAAPSCA